MNTRSILVLALAGGFLGTSPAFGQVFYGQSPNTEGIRDYEREANARGLNLFDYLNQLRNEELRTRYTHGPEAPGPGDYAPYWEDGYQAGLRGDVITHLNSAPPEKRRGYEAGLRAAQRALAEEAARPKPCGCPGPGEAHSPRTHNPFADDPELWALLRPDRQGTGQEGASQRDPVAHFRESAEAVSRYSAAFREMLAHHEPPEAFSTDNEEERLKGAIAYTDAAVKLARSQLFVHVKLNESISALRAAQPEVVAALTRLAAQHRENAQAAQFERTKADFLRNAERLEAKAALIRALVVTSPADFELTGQKIAESYWLLKETLRTLQTEAALSLEGTDFDYLARLRAYAGAYEAWSQDFAAWRSRLVGDLTESLGGERLPSELGGKEGEVLRRDALPPRDPPRSPQLEPVTGTPPRAAETPTLTMPVSNPTPPSAASMAPSHLGSALWGGLAWLLKWAFRIVIGLVVLIAIGAFVSR